MTNPDRPYAERLDLVDELHGHRVADPYRWLEDADDPRTVDWSAAQDELFAHYRAGWAGRNELRERLAQLLAVGSVSTPVWRGERAFLLRRTADQEHAALLTIGPDGAERVLIDPMVTDPTGTTTLDSWYPSADGRLLAYALSTGGTEDSELWVLDTETAAVVDGPIDRVRYSTVGWLADASAFYYIRHLAPGTVGDDNDRLHRRVYLHPLGADPEGDTLVFGDGSPAGRYFAATVSIDGRWLTITQSQGTDPRNDAWVADLTDASPEKPALRLVQQGVDAWTWPNFHNGQLYLFTNRDAPRGRVCTASPDALEYDAWQELIAQDATAVLRDYAVLDGPDGPALLVSRTRHALSELQLHDGRTGETLGNVPLPGAGTVVSMRERPEGGAEAWLSYTDFSSPATVYRYDVRAGTLDEWARPPGAVEAPGLRTRQVSYQSLDGTTVRMFLVEGAGAGDGGGGGGGSSAGPRPTILYGYGGFNIAQAPAYSAMVVAWVEAGGAYAVANLRGGSEEGEEWHRAGMLGQKQNVFDDFHAAGDWLVQHGVTTIDQLAIFGGSNGGLLVGAALTQRPQRYAAVVCSAPLLDMVRYEQFGLGSTWSGEYGSAADPEQLEWLLAYSPYHNVRTAERYPAVLFTVFDGDTRVDPLHARKLAAALQHASTGVGPILLRRERDVGHSARSVSRTVELAADELAFFAQYTGLWSQP
jgi:prolyl oligopeptidase